MAGAKKIVDQAADVSKEAPLAKAKSCFRFVRNIGFRNPVDLGKSFKTIRFNHVKLRDGSYSTYSVYVTDDAKEAQAIRDYAKAHPTALIFEKK